MKNRLKTALIPAFVFMFLLCITTFVYARTVWIEGSVTKVPWHGRYQYIMVNDKKYTFMPKAVVCRRFYNQTGKLWNQRSSSLNRIIEGQKVMIRVQGRRIYKIIIFD